MNHLFARRGLAALALGTSMYTLACGKDARETAGGATATAPNTHSQNKKEGKAGRVIIIQLTSDASGNSFTPSEIKASRGDTVRFTLQVGVHNVNFLPDSNPGKSGLPKASDMLQLPGQTYDLPVTLDIGRYYFQCDPHALLGMKGHLTVEQ